jgi:hypothetical protein
MKPESIDVVVRELRSALAGEPLLVPAGPAWRELLEAIRDVVREPDPLVKIATHHRLSLALLSGLNARLRTSVECAKAIDSARLQ